MEMVKLVIWDMDNTFWRGIISESEIEVVEDNLSIIRTLVDRGIMNAVCSKNRFEDVENVLKELNINDLFIFKIINWESKGKQIRECILKFGFREENVLFIDDNIANLEEARFYSPKINTMTPDILKDKKILKLPELAGREDVNHERLKQYQLIAKKIKKAKEKTSNIDFLKESNIVVTLNYDCKKNVDRIAELISRTNQLNYTKKRILRDEIERLLEDKTYRCGYVTVRDIYGEYGIVGFWAEKESVLEHFLFSCRIIGMGVEQWLYTKLGCPKIVVKGDVVSALNSNDYLPEWINSNDGGRINKISFSTNNILIKGGCDLSQMISYINDDGFVTEFNHSVCRRDHTVLYKGIKEYSENEKRFLIDNCFFIDEESFKSKMFDSKYDVVVLSLLMEYANAIYALRDNQTIKVPYGEYTCSMDEDNVYQEASKEERRFFDENLVFIGRQKGETLYDNLSFVRRNLAKDTALILINGCEIVSTDRKEKEYDRHIIHEEINEYIDGFVENTCNTYLLDMRKIVKGQGDLSDNIRHYKRYIYYKMAVELKKIIDGIF